MSGRGLAAPHDESRSPAHRPALEAVVRRVVAGGDQMRSDPPTDLEEAVDLAVWVLAWDAAERAQPGLVARVLKANRD